MEYTVHFRWQGRDYRSTFPGRDAASVVSYAPLQLMAGAQVIGVERAK